MNAAIVHRHTHASMLPISVATEWSEKSNAIQKGFSEALVSKRVRIDGSIKHFHFLSNKMVREHVGPL